MQSDFCCAENNLQCDVLNDREIFMNQWLSMVPTGTRDEFALDRCTFGVDDIYMTMNKIGGLRALLDGSVSFRKLADEMMMARYNDKLSKTATSYASVLRRMIIEVFHLVEYEMRFSEQEHDSESLDMEKLSAPKRKRRDFRKESLSPTPLFSAENGDIVGASAVLPFSHPGEMAHTQKRPLSFQVVCSKTSLEDFFNSIQLPNLIDSMATEGFQCAEELVYLSDEDFKSLDIPISLKVRIKRGLRFLFPQEFCPIHGQ